MKRILVLSTESPLEAEEAFARLQAAALDAESRQPNQSLVGALTEAPRPCWELWVPEEEETRAREVLAGVREALESMGHESAPTLEEEALAASPQAETPPTSTRPADSVDTNARIAGGLLAGWILLEIFSHIVVRTGPPVELNAFIGWGIRFAIAMSLWSGSLGARKVVTASALLLGLLYVIGLAGNGENARAVGIGLWAAGLLVLMRGGPSLAVRGVGVALNLGGIAISLYMVLAPPPVAKVAVPIEGAWGRFVGTGHIELGFCANDVYVERTETATRRGTWKRTAPDEVELQLESDPPHRYLVTVAGDEATLMASSWTRHDRSDVCAEP